jgi:hypothetical protein
MPVNNQLELAIPDIGAPTRGDGPPALAVPTEGRFSRHARG